MGHLYRNYQRPPRPANDTVDLRSLCLRTPRTAPTDVLPHHPWWFDVGGSTFDSLAEAVTHSTSTGEPIYCRPRQKAADQ